MLLLGFIFFTVYIYLILRLIDFLLTSNLVELGYKKVINEDYIMYSKNCFKVDYKEIFLDLKTKKVDIQGTFNYRELKAINRFLKEKGIVL